MTSRTNELLINKYRPLKINDINISSDTKSLIRKLISRETPSDNIMNINIVGNSGTGKTSLINSILLEYYDVGYITHKRIEANTIFINNLKEQGITYFKYHIQTFCQSLADYRKKTVIVDDMDLLSEQYQAIFVLHIDRYSKNVNFIISSTNTNKLLPNLLSYTIQIPVNNPTPEFIYQINYTISASIQKDINSQDLHNNNPHTTEYTSIKSMINRLEIDRIIGLDIDISDTMKTRFYQYIDYCREKNVKSAVDIILQIYDYGYSIIDILDYLYFYIKSRYHDMYPTQYSNEHSNTVYIYESIKIISRYMLVIQNIYEEVVILKFMTYDLCKIAN